MGEQGIEIAPLDDEDRKRLESIADDFGVSVNELATRVVAMFVDEKMRPVGEVLFSKQSASRARNRH